jgi:hypothetical protein
MKTYAQSENAYSRRESRYRPRPRFSVADGQTVSLAGSGIGGATQSFFRLYGDINADEYVNAGDNSKFHQALTTYNPAFDYNADGYVDSSDTTQFDDDLLLNFAGFTTTI